MMTLIMLVFLSILITGFVVSMRTELSAAYSNENIQRTKMVAQAAVVHGIDLLRSNIPDPAGITAAPGDPVGAPGRNWISNPGRLIVDIGGTDEQIVDLHTGTLHDGDNLTSFDLNQPLVGETAPPIVAVVDGARPNMRVSWANILQDPSKEAGVPLENGDVNAITGRYAFWMDDETSKVNFNVASGKDTDAWKWLEDEWLVPITPIPRSEINLLNDYTPRKHYAVGHPITINLDHLFGEQGISASNQFDRAKLNTHIYTNGWHQFPEAIMEYYDFDGDPEVVDPSERQWYDENKWNLTFYSRSPEFNVFGRSRFFTILNPLAIEGGPTYQMPFTANEVLHLHTLFGGLEHNANEALTNVKNHETLLEYINRDDWPGYSGSFATKWGGQRSAFQVALNIIQMGIIASGGLGETNSKENAEHAFALSFAQDITDGTRNDKNNISTFPERDYWRDDSGNLYLPQTPGPHLTEFQFNFFSEYAGRGRLRRGQRGRLDHYYLYLRYFTEYFMHNNGWVVPTLGDQASASQNGKISPFPTAIDFLRIRTFHPQRNNWDTDPERVATSEWPDVGARRSESARGVRVGLFWGDWRHVAHREMLIDLADENDRTKKFVLAPLHPKRSGSLPGIPDDGGNVRVAISDKFYLPYSDDDGRWNTKGLLTEEEKEKAGSKYKRAHKFAVRTFPGGGKLGEHVHIKLDVRLGLAAPDGKYESDKGSSAKRIFNRPKQVIPMAIGPNAVFPKNTERQRDDLRPDPDDVFTMNFDLTDITKTGRHLDYNGYTCTVEPRVARDKSVWEPTKVKQIRPGVAFKNDSKFRHLQIGWGSDNTKGKNKYAPSARINTNHIKNKNPGQGDRAFNENYRFTSPGYYSLIHTGQMETPPVEHRSLGLLSQSRDKRIYGRDGPPDYVFFDLFAPSFCFDAQQWIRTHRLPDNWSTISYMNSTAGQINLNSKIYPDDGGEDFNPPSRLKPLEAVFVHLRSNENFASDFAVAIDSHQKGGPFAYVGQLAEVPGYAEGKNQFRQEELLRNMMPCLTTKSNTFGLWGAAQTVRKSPSNLKTTPESFEKGDQILGEKRFFALIERYIWPGRDGAPGNAHVDSNGIWDKLALPRRGSEAQIAVGDFLDEPVLYDIPGAPPNISPNNANKGLGIRFAEFDGPDKVDMDNPVGLALADAIHSQSTLEEAYNPPHPVMKYRVVYFKYLDQ